MATNAVVVNDLSSDSPSQKKQLNYINFLQTYGIILVVLGHAHPLSGTFPPFYDILLTFIYSFHMPLFMCISGFLFNYTGGIRNNYLNFRLNSKVSAWDFGTFVLSAITCTIAFNEKTLHVPNSVASEVMSALESFHSVIFAFNGSVGPAATMVVDDLLTPVPNGFQTSGDSRMFEPFPLFEPVI